MSTEPDTEVTVNPAESAAPEATPVSEPVPESAEPVQETAAPSEPQSEISSGDPTPTETPVNP